MNSTLSHFSARFHFCVSYGDLVTMAAIPDATKPPTQHRQAPAPWRDIWGWASLGGGKQGCCHHRCARALFVLLPPLGFADASSETATNAQSGCSLFPLKVFPSHTWCFSFCLIFSLTLMFWATWALPTFLEAVPNHVCLGKVSSCCMEPREAPHLERHALGKAEWWSSSVRVSLVTTSEWSASFPAVSLWVFQGRNGQEGVHRGTNALGARCEGSSPFKMEWMKRYHAEGWCRG